MNPFPADQFRIKSTGKEELLQGFDTLSENEKSERLAAIWEADLMLEKLISSEVESGKDLPDEMKSWLPFKGLSPFGEWKKLRESGKDISPGKLLLIADEVEEKQITIEGLNTEIYGEED